MSKVRSHLNKHKKRLVKKGSSGSEIKVNPTDAEMVEALKSGHVICGFGSSDSDKEIIFIV